MNDRCPSPHPKDLQRAQLKVKVPDTMQTEVFTRRHDVIEATSIPSGSKMSVGKHKLQFHISVKPQVVCACFWWNCGWLSTEALNCFKQTSSRTDSMRNDSLG